MAATAIATTEPAAPTAVEPKAVHRPMSASEYHAHPAIGASMLETFRDSRRKFHALYVAKTMAPQASSAAMDLGTLVHMRLLEPERYAASLADPMPETAPDGLLWNMRKPDHREAWQAAEAERGGNAPDKATLRKVEAIAAAVLSNWHARRLLDGEGQPEFSIFWTDSLTGLKCKCRLDWWATIPLDIKTTRDPEPSAFVKQCVNLGYHRKRHHYLEGIRAYSGPDAVMVHLAVGTEPPHSVCCYEIDDTDSMGQSLGRAEWRKTMFALAKCYETDDWSEPYERQIVTLRLPGWGSSR